MPNNVYSKIRSKSKTIVKSKIHKVADAMEEKLTNMERCIEEIEKIIKKAGAGS